MFYEREGEKEGLKATSVVLVYDDDGKVIVYLSDYVIILLDVNSDKNGVFFLCELLNFASLMLPLSLAPCLMVLK